VDEIPAPGMTTPGDVVSQHAEFLGSFDEMADGLRVAFERRLGSGSKVAVAFDIAKEGFEITLRFAATTRVIEDAWFIAMEDVDAHCTSAPKFKQFMDDQVTALKAVWDMNTERPAPTSSSGWYEATGRRVGPLSAEILASTVESDRRLGRILDLNRSARERAQHERDEQQAIASIAEAARRLADSDTRPDRGHQQAP
jgi:hypothetical protein